MRQQINALEVQRLLSLFRPNFSRTGRITISETGYPTVLRACCFLRFQLRKGALAAIPDEVVERAELNPDVYTGGERQNVTCYLFLATLQELLIKHFPEQVSPWTSTWSDLYSAIRSFFSKRKQARKSMDILVAAPSIATTKEVWQVVVLNDPVNLMTYVTAVLRNVLGLSEEVAMQRMREVHELKSAMVWNGSKEEAERYVCTLKSWHLRAVLRPM